MKLRERTNNAKTLGPMMARGLSGGWLALSPEMRPFREVEPRLAASLLPAKTRTVAPARLPKPVRRQHTVRLA